MRQLSPSSRGPLAGVVAFVALALTLTLMVGNTLGSGRPDSTVTVHALFADASGLGVGDDVRIAGVRVGKVTGTRLDGSRARVTMQFDSEQGLTSASNAEIAHLNIMGQRYVALSRGDGTRGASALRDGDTLPLEQTRGALDLTALFDAFEPLFQQIRPGEVNEFAGNLVAVLQGEGPSYRNLLRQTTTLTGTITDREEVISRVLGNVTLVLETTDDHGAELRRLVKGLGSLSAGLAADRRQIGATMDSVQALTEHTATLVEQTSPAIDRAVPALAGFTRVLARHREHLAAGIAALPKQLDVYLRTLGYGSHLNVYVCRLLVQLPGTPPVRVGNEANHSERCR